MSVVTRSELARLIDHTLLRPDATPSDVLALLAEAADLGVYAVCVSPTMLPLPTARADFQLATVCGFPSGAHTVATKVAEADESVHLGAEEVDMVANLALIKTGRVDDLLDEILSVRRVVPVLKVIIESAALTDDEIVAASLTAVRAGADFVKTSTGFHPAGGATVAAVRLIADTVDGRAQVKASGGIRTYADAVAMVDAGADRLGLSASAAVLAGAPE